MQTRGVELLFSITQQQQQQPTKDNKRIYCNRKAKKERNIFQIKTKREKVADGQDNIVFGMTKVFVWISKD